MSNYDSPNFYIDFSQLPAPSVIETIAYETLLANYKARVAAANPALTAALALEQSATNIILQTEAYGEMILRQRINAAARAVMLPFAIGTDLDNLGALYNVSRLVNIDGSLEADARFRRRIQISVESFSTAGTAGSYIYHALTADPSITDASAFRIDNKGGVKVVIMNTVATPAPTSSQLSNVLAYLTTDNRKVLTDVVRVVGPQIYTTSINATLSLYPGPDASIVVKNAGTALAALRAKLARIGYGLERSAIISALFQEGVENVALTSPTVDVNPGSDGCVFVQSASISIAPSRIV